MKNKWLLLLAGAACICACAAGCGKKDKDSSVEKDSSSVIEESATEDENDLAVDGMDADAGHDSAAQDSSQVSENNLGTFTTQDIYGETVTQEIFADYDLTLVNLFATWCGPCISEMPELSRLHKDMQEQGVNIVAVVLDASYFGEVDPTIVSTAQQLDELIDAGFTFMIPDETNLNGRLDSVSAVPESFFVDSEGNMVGEPYVGARDYNAWKSIIETELANLKGAN